MKKDKRTIRRIITLQRRILADVIEMHSLVNPTEDELEQVWQDDFELSSPEYEVLETLDEALRVLALRDTIEERQQAEGSA